MRSEEGVKWFKISIFEKISIKLVIIHFDWMSWMKMWNFDSWTIALCIPMRWSEFGQNNANGQNCAWMKFKQPRLSTILKVKLHRFFNCKVQHCIFNLFHVDSSILFLSFFYCENPDICRAIRVLQQYDALNII